MEVKAQHKNARMAPRKLRLLRELVLGLPVTEAEAQLHFRPSKAAGIVRAVLASAVANAKANHEIAADTLRVADVIVDEGIVMKRFQPVSRGRAHSILKRTSHVTVVVEETGVASGAKSTKKKKKAEIETISAADFAQRAAEEAREEVSTADEDSTLKGRAGARPSKQEQTSGKMKMQQQGGDKATRHRRKSMSDS